MGGLWGHVVHGLAFVLFGIWHLLSHMRYHFLHPKSYTSLPWFPTSKFRYLELFLIMGGSVASISLELFISPSKHQPLDPDGTIPSSHLHNFEHSNISLTFFVYALFAIILDKIQPPAQYGLTQMLGAIAFGQQFLLLHLHSTDHMGLEGQYHGLLQIVILVSFFTTFLSIGYPKSFLNSFIRSFSILFQGIWLMIIGIMLWTPEYIPKGCFIKLQEGHYVVRCHDHEALERAKALVNIQFSWYLTGVTLFGLCLYLVLYKMFLGKVDYQSLTSSEDDDDIETQKRNKETFSRTKE
ncbi:uncharacterized protein LOC113749331 [Coffea eugenioides]|uniref:uncharacterized protein LOC113749331 n=1 Tax=Coffea eugenioides TaxID=49369 RepID=UPI000F6121AC|nr:uncharacterized protein LOC113749331 [Coffea eugenioides]